MWLQLVMPYEAPQVATKTEVETWTFDELRYMSKEYIKRCERLNAAHKVN